MLGPGDRAGLRDAGAVPVDDGRRRRTARCSRAPATKARSSASTRRGKGVGVLRHRRARGARARARARRRPLRRHVARRQDLQGRSRRAVARRSSIPTTSTSGRWRSTRDGNALRRHRRQGRHLQDHARRQGRARSTRRRRRTRSALALDKAGNLLVGTESPGKVLRIDADGKAFVLLDSPFQEIRALRFDDKGTALRRRAQRATPGGDDRRSRRRVDHAGRRTPRPRRCRRCPPRSRRSRSSTSAPAAAASRRRPRDDRGTPQGRGLPHRARRLWDSSGSRATTRRTTCSLETDGALLVGTGNKGKMYRLDGDPLRPTLLARADAQQVTALYNDATGRV